MVTHFESVPNVTRVTGDENAELVTQRMEITDTGVTLMTRNGYLGGPSDIDIPYSQIVRADGRGQYNYNLVVETGSKVYEITNVSTDQDELAAMVSLINDRATQVQASYDRSRAGDTSTGNTAATSGGQPSQGGRRSTGSDVGPTESENARSGGSASGPDGGGGSDDGDVTEQLRRFAELRDDGIISEEEFQAKKQQLLDE